MRSAPKYTPPPSSVSSRYYAIRQEQLDEEAMVDETERQNTLKSTLEKIALQLGLRYNQHTTRNTPSRLYHCIRGILLRHLIAYFDEQNILHVAYRKTRFQQEQLSTAIDGAFKPYATFNDGKGLIERIELKPFLF